MKQLTPKPYVDLLKKQLGWSIEIRPMHYDIYEESHLGGYISYDVCECNGDCAYYGDEE